MAHRHQKPIWRCHAKELMASPINPKLFADVKFLFTNKNPCSTIAVAFFWSGFKLNLNTRYKEVGILNIIQITPLHWKCNNVNTLNRVILTKSLVGIIWYTTSKKRWNDFMGVYPPPFAIIKWAKVSEEIRYSNTKALWANSKRIFKHGPRWWGGTGGRGMYFQQIQWMFLW